MPIQNYGSTLLTVLLITGCSSSENTPDTGQAIAQLPAAQNNCNASATDIQAAMLDAINTARASQRSCGSDNFSATSPLSWNDQLETAARNHSNDMASNNFFDHTGSDGLSASARVTATGYNWSNVGENIAGGQPTVATAVQAWLDSPGHCANIMSTQFQQMAVACQSSSSSSLPTYWTAVFGTPQ